MIPDDTNSRTGGLKSRSVRAVFWSGTDLILRQGLRFVVTIVLARLIAPDEFGAIAMLFLFVGLGSLFIDSGFGTALIQRQNAKPEDESTVFIFNLAVGGAVALLLVLFAPAIAAFFDLAILRPLTYVMAANLFIGAFASIHIVLLTKELDFRTQMKASATSQAISGVIAVVLAWMGFGVWSLAAQIVVATVINVLLLWILHPWRPRAGFRLASLRSLFRFGGFMLLSRLLNTLHERLYTLLIGRLYAAADLGFFSRAESTQQIPASLLTSILDRVAFPVFSAAATDKARLMRGVRSSLTTIVIVNTPIMLGMAVTAGPLVQVLFGDMWSASVPLLRILCFSGIFWPLHVINLNVLMAQGRSDLFLRIEVVKSVFGVLVLLAASVYSVMAVAVGYVIVSFVSFLINSYYSGTILGYGALQQARDVLPYVGISVIMAACIWPISLSEALSPPVLLLLQFLAGITVFVGGCKFLGLRAFNEAADMLSVELRRHLGRPNRTR